MAKKHTRTDPQPKSLERQVAENRDAIRVLDEMYRAILREVEEARIQRLPKKHRPKKRPPSK